VPRKKSETEKERKEEKEIKKTTVKNETKKTTKKDDAKKKLLEKAKKLAAEIKEEKTEEIKEKIKEKKGTLIPLEDYIKAGSYIGTKVITPDMRPYVYRRRADGIALINTNFIDEKLKEAIDFLVKYEPENFIVVCKREAGWRAVKLFSELTGVKVFTKKYPAGIITNITLPDFFETDLIFICDPWLDRNALRDALNIKKKVMSICDTNNLTKGIEVIIPANNKGNKSLGLIFWIIAREYLKSRKIDKKLPDVEEFIGEKLEER